MRRMMKYSSFRLALATLVEISCALLGLACEAVLGADFDDFQRVHTADSAPDLGSSRDGPRDDDDVAAGGSGGAPGEGSGDRDAADGASSDPDSGGGSGTEDGGESGEASGIDDAASKSDASEPSDARLPNDASIDTRHGGGDAPGDPTSFDAADTSIDLSTPPPDGATGGGSCTPNEVRSIATCGNCGLFLQICNAQGMWDLPFCRQEPSACAPGSIERRVCSAGGTQVATCNGNCTWSLGACVVPPCAMGQTEVSSCALCGTQTRTCELTEAGLAWGPLSSCSKQGVCAPGTSDVTTCGKCGTYSRVCNATCAWDHWGACTGEGECAAGSTETRSCVIIPFVLFGKQSRKCAPSCAWTSYDNCK